jgi:hypothetical protein
MMSLTEIIEPHKITVNYSSSQQSTSGTSQKPTK